VQGVGFRPFIERLARRHRLAGFVHNDASVVVIEVEGDHGDVERFERELPEQAPPLARINTVTAGEAEADGALGFRIVASQDAADGAIVRSPLRRLSPRPATPRLGNYPDLV
jgi:hydrogenase maturation protein HypF